MQGNMQDKKTDSRLEWPQTAFGRVTVSTVPVPDFVKEIHHPTYTFTGRILMAYKTAEQLQDPFAYSIGIMADDGGEFRTLFTGEIPEKKTANGTRYMPFPNNKGVLLGDYVLECTPDLDHCRQAVLVPVSYPADLMWEERLFKHWSEIVIAPDNVHMAWTALVGDGAVNFMGQLHRDSAGYTLKNVRSISATGGFQEDPERPGVLHPLPMIGGEIKQFVKGGRALSLVGSVGSVLPDSVIQDLETGETAGLTCMPGYEETTILSPDERLGITMSTRGSPETNFAILGLLPRPYGYLVTQGLSRYVYMNAVTAVRRMKQGNIGPVLVDIAASRNDRRYQGLQLNAPQGDWVYSSPMSWHPGGQKALWPEVFRGENRRMRIRRVDLPDHPPGPAVPPVPVPEAADYSGDPAEALRQFGPKETQGEFLGKHSGSVRFRLEIHGETGESFTETLYQQYSDDGENFYQGFERIRQSPQKGADYAADLCRTGTDPGEMKLRLAFPAFSYDGLPLLLTDPAEDGRPQSGGFAQYAGQKLTL